MSKQSGKRNAVIIVAVTASVVAGGLFVGASANDLSGSPGTDWRAELPDRLPVGNGQGFVAKEYIFGDAEWEAVEEEGTGQAVQAAPVTDADGLFLGWFVRNGGGVILSGGRDLPIRVPPVVTPTTSLEGGRDLPQVEVDLDSKEWND